MGEEEDSDEDFFLLLLLHADVMLMFLFNVDNGVDVLVLLCSTLLVL